MKPTSTRRVTFALAGLLTLALGSAGRPQGGSPPLPSPLAEPALDLPLIAAKVPPMPAPAIDRAALTPVVTQPAPTIERLIEQLEQLHAKKLELEQQEKTLKAELKTALVIQQGRLIKVGIPPSPPPGPSTPPVPAPASVPPVPPKSGF